MIRGLVDFALNNRFLVLALAVLLLVWGAISFHNLPVEAYPDVANNYVQVITQWPGPRRRRSGAAGHDSARNRDERNSAPDASALRVAVRTLERDADLRRRLGERLEPAEGSGAARAGDACRKACSRRSGTDCSPVGQIYWYTLHEHQSAIRRDGAEVA